LVFRFYSDQTKARQKMSNQKCCFSNFEFIHLYKEFQGFGEGKFACGLPQLPLKMMFDQKGGQNRLENNNLTSFI